MRSAGFGPFPLFRRPDNTGKPAGSDAAQRRLHRLVPALALLLALCACDETLSNSTGTVPAAITPATAVTSAPRATAAVASVRIAVSNRAVVIAGPSGYCIDQPAARETPSTAFVLLGSCAAIAHSSAETQPGVPAVLTASVGMGSGQAISTQFPALNSFFNSDTGRAALARSGRANAVTVLQTTASDGVFYLAARDTSPITGAKVQPEFWRAVLDIKGRIVTLNVVGLRATPLSASAGLATLQAFVRQVRREN